MYPGRGGRPTAPRITTTLLATSCIALLLAAGAHADALSDLRATLATLQGHAPIQATLDVKLTTTSKKQNSDKPVSANARLKIQAGDGLSVHIAQVTLQQAATEAAAAATNADHPAPTVALLNNGMNPATLDHLVSEAPNFLRVLALATAVSVKSTTLWGEPVRELSVTLPKPKSANLTLKDYSDVLTLWLDAQGILVASSEQTKFKACLLFLCAHTASSASKTLQVANGRLVATRQTTDQQLNGLGQDSDTQTVYTLQIQPAPAAATSTPPTAVSKP